MTRKFGLGKGLDSLIPQSDFASDSPAHGPGIIQIPLEAILPNPRQPRTNFAAEGLEELAASIREHGVIQPLIVTQAAQPGQYTLIAGERRWRAAQQAGLASVPAILRNASDQQLVELALIENLQRADLGPLEAAEAFRQLHEDFSLSHEEVAARVGKSRVAITNTLRLLKLPPAVQQAIADGRISEGHARALLALPTPQAQAAALHTVLQHDLNVRQTEELVRKLSGQKLSLPARPPAPPEITSLESRLRDRLGTRVTLNARKRGGTVVIYYYSDEELNALVNNLLGAE